MTRLLNARTFTLQTSVGTSTSGTEQTWQLAAGDGAKFPSQVPYPLVIWSQTLSRPDLDANMEVVYVVAQNAGLDQVTVLRGMESTTAAAHTSGDKLIITPTAGLVENNFVGLSVRDFGARGDGVTDDTLAFQRTHDALPAVGGTIFIPAGDYLFNQNVQANQFKITKSNVALVGVGFASRLKKTNTGVVTGNQALVMIRPTAGTISNIRLANFSIQGPTPNTGAVISADNRVVGIMIHDSTTGSDNDDVTDVLIENILIEQMETAAFTLASGLGTGRNRRVTFKNCWARKGRQDGFNDFSGGTYDLLLEGCYATDLDGFGMEMATFGGLKIIGCIVRRTGQAGIGIEYNNTQSPLSYVDIENCLIEDIETTGYPHAQGISLGQSQNPVNTKIIGTTIHRVGGHGIKIGLTPDRIQVLNCVIQDVGKGAVDKHGINMGAAGTNLRFLGNVIHTSAAGYAMDLGIAFAGAGSDTNIAFGNDVRGAANGAVAGNLPNRVWDLAPDFIGIKNPQSTNLELAVENTDASATANARLRARTKDGGAGDAYTLYSIGAIEEYCTGIDNSDGDAYGIWRSSVPGTNPRLKLGPLISHGVDVARLKSTIGTALIAGDFALSAGWGTTASISAVAGNDTRGRFTVSSSGTGQAANPTVTLTFKDGAFAAAPFAIVRRNGGNQPAVEVTWTISTTQLIITFNGTPVTGESYVFEYILVG